MITPGAIVIALRIDTIVADAPNEEIAMMGMAVRVMRLPTALTACAAHKRRKSACAHRDCVTEKYSVHGLLVERTLGRSRTLTALSHISGDSDNELSTMKQL